MNADKLKKILADHKLWVESDYQSGKRANLCNAVLIGANLRYADLNSANLIGANLRYADLHSADLSRSDLNGANLNGADLNGANLDGAHLHGADLHGAYLTRAILHGADLSYADLTGAHLQLEFKSVRYFRNAIFSEAAIPWVILNPHWTEYADTVTFV